MAIVKMTKCKLIGIAYEESAVLDALQRTGAVQVTLKSETPETSDAIKASETVAKTRAAVETLLDVAARFDKETKAQTVPAYCDVSYEEFVSVADNAALMSIVDDVTESTETLNACASRCTRIDSEIAHYAPYRTLSVPFSQVSDTKHTMIAPGTVPSETVKLLTESINALDGAVCEVLSAGSQSTAVVIAAHHDVRSDAESLMTTASFAKCTFTDTVTAQARITALEAEKLDLEKTAEEIKKRLYGYKSSIDGLKTLADYHAYLYEKSAVAEGFERTKETFCLEGFVPTKECDRVREEVEKVTEAVYFEFCEPNDDDEVPTLTHNNRVVRQFEFITNLYSPPNYRERDPNTVMGIFFMVFFGIIMADMGYGLVITLAGLIMGLRARKTSGSRPLMLLIGMGGIFTIVVGALFGSFFGYSVFPSVLPNPEREPATLLVYSLAIGVLQLLVGYVIKGVQSQSEGNFFDGLFDGYTWALFCIGILLIVPELGVSLFKANIGFTPPQVLLYAGLGVAGAALLIAVAGAGRKEKGFGKFSKGFGAVYGVIGFLSDVLSYARLFGLMLSGAIVSRIVTEMSLGMMTGVGGIIIGCVILLIGHTFNLAMNLLGAYIHDSRLQYIEYFSRFYKGEGVLFSPLGSQFNYITLKK